MIALRRAVHADVAAITALVRAAYAPWTVVMGRKPGPMLFDYARAVADTIVDLHHVDGTLAALIQMKTAQDHMMLINLAVAPDFQGKGIGRALMAHGEQATRAHGLQETRLFTNRLMGENIAFYERLGYRFDREEPFRGGTVVHMSKQL